jgi:N,N'-diacetyllegionaminate synthase
LLVGERTYVIAEIGVNHCGSMERAHELIDVAVEAGADAAKFQTFRTEELVRADQIRMPYQNKDRCGDISQFDMLKVLELDESQHRTLQDYCRKRGIEFISTPYDTASVDLLLRLGVKAIKVASTDMTNIPLLRYIARARLPVICSTGICDLWEVAKAMEAFGERTSDVVLLHCLSNYPAPIDELNLGAIRVMGAAFGVPVGFSDHTMSLDTGAWAVCAGAAVVEKHITFDNGAVGPDHAASLEPKDFNRYVANIRAARQAMGDGRKRIQDSERAVKRHMQKSLVAARALKVGERLNATDLATMRPADGISPLFVDQVVGRKLRASRAPQDPVRWEDLDFE